MTKNIQYLEKPVKRNQIHKYGWKKKIEELFFNELVRNTGIHCTMKLKISGFKSLSMVGKIIYEGLFFNELVRNTGIITL